MRRRLKLLASLVPLAVGTFAAGGFAAAAGGHAAITIASDSDFVSCGCVTAGDGSASNPFVIGPFAISAPSNGTTGWAVKVDNSKGRVTKFFNITGITPGYTDNVPSDPIIWLVKVSNATTVSNSSANEDGTGIEIDSSSNITLDSLSFNKMLGPAGFINGSSFISLSNSKLKATSDGVPMHNADGLYVLNSTNVKIGGVPACPHATICNTFDYDSGFGVYIQGGSNITISRASDNADDTAGFVLDGTSNVDLGFSNSQATGPICITVSGQRVATGYHSTDLQGGVLLINGARNSSIHDDIFSANTGFGIASGGSGLYFNPCTGANESVAAEAAMGTGNTFNNDCYGSNTVGLPPNPCK